MAQARFKFEFFQASEKQAGALANMTVEFWVDSTCIVRTRGWQIRDGRNGLFASGPQYKTNKTNPQTGKAVYGNYVQFWPRTYDSNRNVTSNTDEKFKAFQNECVAAYTTWLQNGGKNNESPDDDGSSLAPSIPSARGAMAPATTAPVLPNAVAGVLPAGWTTSVDRRSGKRYFSDTKGNVYMEGDPRLDDALSISATPTNTKASDNDPFASFGSVPGR
jgi:hypothetical protein